MSKLPPSAMPSRLFHLELREQFIAGSATTPAPRIEINVSDCPRKWWSKVTAECVTEPKYIEILNVDGPIGVPDGGVDSIDLKGLGAKYPYRTKARRWQSPGVCFT
jgi:hypothetical protein